MQKLKAILIVSVLLFGIVIAYFFSSKIEQKTPSISITLSKEQSKGIRFDYKMLHNLYNSGGNLEIIDYVNVVSANCRASIENNSDIKTLKFHLRNYSEDRQNVTNYSAELEVSGVFLSSTPKRTALKYVSVRFREAYEAIMRCYKNKVDRETLLD